MNAIFAPLAAFFQSLFQAVESLSPGFNAWIEAKVTANAGIRAEKAMKRRFGIALHQLKKKPLTDVPTLVSLEFTDLTPALQQDAVKWLTSDLQFKK